MTNRRRWDFGFLALLAGAAVLYVHAGRDGWFFLDEWDFLGHRELGSADDLFRPHNEHWSTLPIIVYRSLYAVFGLRTYVPYQLVVVALHLTAAWLLRAVMLRSKVPQPIAFAAASLFALFGPGYQNIIWAFQIGFTGALVAGVVHLILADHDGPVGRRDVVGVMVGLLGLMTAGVSVAMTAGVGVAVLLRRGRRAAAVHVVPLAAIYLVWFATVGRTGYERRGTDVAETVEFVRRGAWATLQSLGQLSFSGVVFALALLAAVAVAITEIRRDRSRAAVWAAPLGLLTSGVLFIGISGLGRAASLGAASGETSRYQHLLAAAFLPAIAVGLTRAAARHDLVAVGAVLLLVVGIPANIGIALEDEGFDRARLRGNEPLVTAMAESELLAAIAPPTAVSGLLFDYPTAAFLTELDREGALRGDVAITPRIRSLARTHLSFRQIDEDDVVDCVDHSGPTAALDEGEALVVVDGDAVRFRLADGGAQAPFLGLDPGADGVVSTRAGAVVEFTADSDDLRVRRCSAR